mgnify:CR=1 FL=1
MKLKPLLLSLVAFASTSYATIFYFIDTSGFPIFVSYNIATTENNNTTWSGIQSTPEIQSTQPYELSLPQFQNNQKIYIQTVSVEDFKPWEVGFCMQNLKYSAADQCITGCYMDNLNNSTFFQTNSKINYSQSNMIYCSTGVVISQF